MRIRDHVDCTQDVHVHLDIGLFLLSNEQRLSIYYCFAVLHEQYDSRPGQYAAFARVFV